MLTRKQIIMILMVMFPIIVSYKSNPGTQTAVSDPAAPVVVEFDREGRHYTFTFTQSDVTVTVDGQEVTGNLTEGAELEILLADGAKERYRPNAAGVLEYTGGEPAPKPEKPKPKPKSAAKPKPQPPPAPAPPTPKEQYSDTVRRVDVTAKSLVARIRGTPGGGMNCGSWYFYVSGRFGERLCFTSRLDPDYTRPLCYVTWGSTTGADINDFAAENVRLQVFEDAMKQCNTGGDR